MPLKVGMVSLKILFFYKYTGNSKAELKPDDFYKRISASSDYDEAEKN